MSAGWEEAAGLSRVGGGARGSRRRGGAGDRGHGHLSQGLGPGHEVHRHPRRMSPIDSYSLMWTRPVASER